MKSVKDIELVKGRLKDNPLIRDFLKLDGSTTRFFEKISGKQLKVKVNCQDEVVENTSIMILRESLLYFYDEEHPLLFCTCRLAKREFNDNELKLLRSGKIPLGKIFAPDDKRRLRKTYIEITWSEDWEMAKKLKTFCSLCCTKRYDLLLDNRKVARISETMNEDSILRIFD